jgi:hypothetical protein
MPLSEHEVSQLDDVGVLVRLDAANVQTDGLEYVHALTKEAKKRGLWVSVTDTPLTRWKFNLSSLPFEGLQTILDVFTLPSHTSRLRLQNAVLDEFEKRKRLVNPGV